MRPEASDPEASDPGASDPETIGPENGPENGPGKMRQEEIAPEPRRSSRLKLDFANQSLRAPVKSRLSLLLIDQL